MSLVVAQVAVVSFTQCKGAVGIAEQITQLDAIQFIFLSAAQDGICDAHLGISRVIFRILHIDEILAGRIFAEGFAGYHIRSLVSGSNLFHILHAVIGNIRAKGPAGMDSRT